MLLIRPAHGIYARLCPSSLDLSSRRLVQMEMLDLAFKTQDIARLNMPVELVGLARGFFGGRESEWRGNDGSESLLSARWSQKGFYALDHRRREVERIDDRFL